jgi:hypothetical protein
MSVDLHPAQSLIYEAMFVERTARWFPACCSRGFGKSYLAAVAATTAIAELLTLVTSVPNKTVYIIAPTLDQAKDIYFPLLVNDFNLDLYTIKPPARDTGRFYFPKGVILQLTSYEAIERMRGKGAYFVVMDEVSSWTKGMGFKAAWEDIIQPAITTRWSKQAAKLHGAPSPGRALIISTPKGFNYFQEICTYHESDEDWTFFHFTYRDSPYLDPEDIEKLRDRIDAITFATEYEADFKESGASVFYSFDRNIHVRKDLEPFKEGEDVHICIDFNVMLQCSAVCAIRGHQVHFLEEFKGHPDTDSLAQTIKSKYIDKGHRVFAYPDPSGNSRKTSAPVGVTDFSILRSYGITVLARSKAPPIVDSVAAVNGKLLNARGVANMFFHPDAKLLINSMERTVWLDSNPDLAVIDKTNGDEHFSDGVRYLTEFLYPIRGKRGAKRGFGF